jgi:tRNA A37 threonylcarbamoyladenosine dehydratase
METLTIEPTYRVVLGDVKHFRIMLVDVGGTGSTLALFLAGLAFHAQQKGTQVEITLVDDDTIEAKNVGRQHFAASRAPRFKLYLTKEFWRIIHRNYYIFTVYYLL